MNTDISYTLTYSIKKNNHQIDENQMEKNTSISHGLNICEYVEELIHDYIYPKDENIKGIDGDSIFPTQTKFDIVCDESKKYEYFDEMKTNIQNHNEFNLGDGVILKFENINF